MRSINLTLSACIIASLIGCSPGKLREQANQKFGDQHFKTAIALIELHKMRYGDYPVTLDSLKYLGDWDKIIFTSVRYKKHGEGYDLDLVNGWLGKPNELKYPPEFWKGLGILQSNLKN